MRNGIKYFRSVVIFGVLWLRDVFGFLCRSDKGLWNRLYYSHENLNDTYLSLYSIE